MKDIFESHPVSVLKKEIAKTNIKGYSKMKKAEVIELMIKNKDKFGHIKMADKKPVKRAVKAVKAVKEVKAVKAVKEEKKEEKKEEPKTRSEKIKEIKKQRMEKRREERRKAIEENNKTIKNILLNTKESDLKLYFDLEKEYKRLIQECWRKEDKFGRKTHPKFGRNPIFDETKEQRTKRLKKCKKEEDELIKKIKSTNFKLKIEYKEMYDIRNNPRKALVDIWMTKTHDEKSLFFDYKSAYKNGR